MVPELQDGRGQGQELLRPGREGHGQGVRPEDLRRDPRALVAAAVHVDVYHVS